LLNSRLQISLYVRYDKEKPLTLSIQHRHSIAND